MSGLNSASLVSRWLLLPKIARRPFRGSDLIRSLEQPETYLWLMASVILLLLLWASFTSVDKVVRVEGRIIPAGHSQSIQHLEGGIVSAIMAQEGAVVRKGEVLLTIDDTSAQANLAESTGKLQGLRIRTIRLDAEARGLSIMVVPDSLRQGREQVDTELHLFTARRQKLLQEQHIFEEQISQRHAELTEIQSRHGKLAAELETARQRLKMMTAMATRNAASQLEVLEAQSREQRLLTELSDAENAQPKVLAAIAEAEARIQDSQARYRAEAQGDLSTTQVEIERLENTITTQADRATRTDVRAPVDGIVNRITINTVGGVLKPGDTIVEITPSTQDIVLEAHARPSDRGELHVGLPAKVRVSAYDVGELGILTGHVTEVSADTVADAKGDPYYRVAIQVDQLPESYAGKQIVPGMTITGDVVTGRRTVMQYITAPFTRFVFNAFRDAR
jgi:adhesin transport system membrane fusion protein